MRALYLLLALFCAGATLLPSSSEYGLLQNVFCQLGAIGWAFSAGRED